MNEFVGSMAKKVATLLRNEPEGLGLKSPSTVLSTIYLDG
jgi:hypothetical protein